MSAHCVRFLSGLQVPRGAGMAWEEMIFQHSAVSDVTARQCVETHGRLPLDIHPAYLGSGPVAFALDATGMQGLDARHMEQPETIGLVHSPGHITDDLHVYHAATLSLHHLAEARRAGVDPAQFSKGHGQLPAGWFDYVLTLDGERFDADRLAAVATDWRREFTPHDGTVRTTFVVAGVEVEWLATIGRNSPLALFQLTVRSRDGAAHTATLAVRVHLTTREGVNLAQGGLTPECTARRVVVQWDASTATSTAPLKEPYTFTWGIALHRPAQGAWEAPVLTATTDCAVPAVGEAVVECALYLGCSQARTGSRDRAGATLDAWGVDPAASRARAQASWTEFFADTASFSIGVPQIEYLYAASQYLLAAGGDWAWGLPSNFLWNHNWGGAVFWDMHFATDGMLRAGHADTVRPFLGWLARVAERNLPGRPFYFVQDYDGDRPWGEDQAHQVLAAHGGAMIRYYESTRDEAALRDWIYPVLKRIAAYTCTELVGRDGDVVRLRAPVANDVGVAPAADCQQETGILVWLVVVLAKAVEYGRQLGEEEATLASWKEVVENLRQHPCDWSQPGMWWLWLPYLTAGEPFYQLNTWREGVRREQLLVAAPARRAPEGDTSHLRYFEGFCPWFQFSQAASFFLTGLPDVGWELLQAGLRGVYGLGVFSEVRYDHGLCVANAPFMGGTGAYLSACAGLFVNSTVWSADVRVCDALPQHLQRRAITFRNVWSLNGACVSGTYTPTAVRLTVTTRWERQLIIGVPVRLHGVPLEVRRDGQPVAGTLAGDGRTINVTVPAGEFHLELEEDHARRAEVVLYEAKARAAAWQAALAAHGLSARLVRDPRRLGAALAGARVLVLPSSLVTLPVYLAEAVERFVQAGGGLVALHHAGCAAINPRLAALLGVNGESENRFANQYRAFEYAVFAEHPITAGVAGAFSIQEADRILTPRLSTDVTVLVRNAATGDAVATVRSVGAAGGVAVWLAPGQETAGRQPAYQDWGVDTLRVLGLRVDEIFTYPYLEHVDFQRLLANAVRFAAGRRPAEGAHGNERLGTASPSIPA